MLIRFWFGAIHIGRPSHIGSEGDYDASITWCWGRRGYDVPPGELKWRYIRRFSWDWLPVAIFNTESTLLDPANRAYAKLIASISGGGPQKSEIISSHWTGREKFVGWSHWRSSLTVLRSTRRSKMYVYLAGQKERESSHHMVYVAPAAYPGVDRNDVPSDWLIGVGDKAEARTFEVKFNHGRAEVEQNLGEFMIKHGLCNRTRLVRPSAGLLGGLARAISGR